MQSHFLALKRACTRLTKVASTEALSRTGLYGAQAQALLILSELDGCRISDLGTQLNLGRPGTTTLVNRMEKEKLIYREPDRNDARATFIRLTPIGRLALDGVIRMIRAFDARLVEGLNVQEVEIIKKYLSRAAQIKRL